MKTTNQTTERFPDGFRMILYIAAVAALGFLSCTLKAADSLKASDYAARLDAVAEIQAEPEIRLEDWMLNFNEEAQAEAEDEHVVLEDWMTDPAYFEIPGYLIVEKEEEPVLEDWMLDPAYYVDIQQFIVENNQ